MPLLDRPFTAGNADRRKPDGATDSSEIVSLLPLRRYEESRSSSRLLADANRVSGQQEEEEVRAAVATAAAASERVCMCSGLRMG